MYADLPPTPGFSDENSELGFSRGVSMITVKSAGIKSDKSRFNARLDLMDRGGASGIPGDRLEPLTPLSDPEIDDLDIQGPFTVQEVEEEGSSPFMKDPLAIFDEDLLEDGFGREMSNLSAKDLAKSRNALKSRDTARSKDSFEALRLKERTATELSYVGPLPKFEGDDHRGKNFDDVSTDSAIESGAMSLSEYATSHYSEKMTVSHLDHQSVQDSQVSEDNNMFDVERISTLDYEGEFEGVYSLHDIEEIYRMKSDLEIANLHHMHALVSHGDSQFMNASMMKFNSMGMPVLENNFVMGLDGLQDLIEEENENEIVSDRQDVKSDKDDKSGNQESGKISVMITPRGSTTPAGSIMGIPRYLDMAFADLGTCCVFVCWTGFACYGNN